jgi:hypothetical protein
LAEAVEIDSVSGVTFKITIVPDEHI